MNRRPDWCLREVLRKTFYQKVSQGQGKPAPFIGWGNGQRRPSMAGDCRRFVTRGRGNGGPGGRHLHTVLVTMVDMAEACAWEGGRHGDHPPVHKG